jgi:hypothetical protein
MNPMHSGLTPTGRPWVLSRTAVVSGAVALVGTLFVGVVLAPWLADVLASLSELEAFGATLLFGSSVRLLAGLYGARAYRRRLGTQWRTEPLASVLLGVALAWLGYAVLVAATGAAVGGGMSWRVLLELPRWLVESGLGALIAQCGEPEDLTVVQRLARRGAGA